MKPSVKVYSNRIEVRNQIGITPDTQGETGLLFPRAIIKKAVGDYKKLLEAAPYYRIMLDSHVDINEAKWENAAGLIDGVDVNESGAAVINYTIFGGTPIYKAVSLMIQTGMNGACPVSTRGFGSSKKIQEGPNSYGRTPSDKKIKTYKKLSDSTITYWRTLGKNIHKGVIKELENFVLLGWDLVVVPSQNATGLSLLDSNLQVVGESCGSEYTKLLGEPLNLQSYVMGDLEDCSNGSCLTTMRESAATLSLVQSKVTPPVRLNLLDPQSKFASNIEILQRGDSRIIKW